MNAQSVSKVSVRPILHIFFGAWATLVAVFCILWIGMGQPSSSVVPGISFVEVFRQGLNSVNLFAIPASLSVGIIALAMYFSSLEDVDGFSRHKGSLTFAETTFILLGLWVGASLAMSINPGGELLVPRHAMTWMFSSFGGIGFLLLAITTRQLR